MGERERGREGGRGREREARATHRLRREVACVRARVRRVPNTTGSRTGELLSVVTLRACLGDTRRGRRVHGEQRRPGARMERRGRGRGLSGVPTLGAVGDAPSSSTSKRMGLRWSTMNICVAIGTLALVVVAIFNTGIVAVRYLLCARSSEREREGRVISLSSTKAAPTALIFFGT